MAIHVKAQITGTVCKIEVALGDSVELGQTVIVLESMKMELPVEAPRAGQVTAVLVSEGEAVEQGRTLLTLG